MYMSTDLFSEQSNRSSFGKLSPSGSNFVAFGLLVKSGFYVTVFGQGRQNERITKNNQHLHPL